MILLGFAGFFNNSRNACNELAKESVDTGVCFFNEALLLSEPSSVSSSVFVPEEVWEAASVEGS